MAIRQLFGAPPCDEIALWEKATKFSCLYKNRLPNNSELISIGQKESTDAATMVLYQSILQHPNHKDFINEINNTCISTDKFTKPLKLLVVPGLYYKQHPEVGSDGALFNTIASSLGIETETIPILSLGSVRKNTEIIVKYIEKQSHSNIWLISTSKGGAEVKRVLQEYNDSDVSRKIKGWINICGITNGTRLADRKLTNPLNRIIHRLLYRLMGLSYSGLKEISTHDPFMKAPFKPQQHIQVLHVIGMPLLSHLQPYLLRRYGKLCNYGPNDGIIVTRESLLDQGYIYPVWGVDHFFRHPNISELLYKLFTYIININDKQIHPNR